MKQDYQVIIIGSGFGGQLAAMNLIKRGIQDFLILERREFVGGTWSQNTYPGAAVDVPSPLYSISSEPYNWSQMFAEQDELREYTEHIIS
ncbi:NAD(P)-binding protein, partial [Oleiphilus sp. HI0132]